MVCIESLGTYLGAEGLEAFEEGECDRRGGGFAGGGGKEAFAVEEMGGAEGWP